MATIAMVTNRTRLVVLDSSRSAWVSLPERHGEGWLYVVEFGNEKHQVVTDDDRNIVWTSETLHADDDALIEAVMAEVI